MKVAILGCGPAGLLAAHAAERHGHDPYIYSKKNKSWIPGSQHLHGPVPGLTPVYPSGTIQFVRLGSKEGYAEKVYGDPARETGWGNYFQVYPSWSVQDAYDKLWDRYEARVVDQDVTPGWLWEVQEDFPLVISTIPGQAICEQPTKHSFKGQPYWIKVLPTPPDDEHHELVVYNGLKEDHWYRWSILGGKCAIETTALPYEREMGDWQEGTKAIGNNCDCWPTIVRAGRWAEWTHGVTLYKTFCKIDALMEAKSNG